MIASLILAALSLPCEHHPAAQMLVYLAEHYNEVPKEGGRNKDGFFIMTASPESGTWTFLELFEDKSACMMDSGIKWQAF